MRFGMQCFSYQWKFLLKYYLPVLDEFVHAKCTCKNAHMYKRTVFVTPTHKNLHSEKNVQFELIKQQLYSNWFSLVIE